MEVKLGGLGTLLTSLSKVHILWNVLRGLWSQAVMVLNPFFISGIGEICNFLKSQFSYL